MKTNELKTQILELKKDKNAVLLAHYYQRDEIQELADFVGDSLELAKKAKQTDADIILFAGVHFMAETAKIINPNKKVILPDLEAGCSLADSCPTNDFEEFVNNHPDHRVVTYINCSAEIKALSDVVCTSSNAETIINSIDIDTPIIFAPDKNLGKHLIQQTGRDLLLWDGACTVHEAFSVEKLLTLWKKHPNAKVLAHPESEPHLLKVADFIGSTAKIIDYFKNSKEKEFIIATEAGIIHEMKKHAGDKTIIPAPVNEDNSCACSECHYMKLNTLQKVYDCLKDESPAIEVPELLQKEALIPIERMLDLSTPSKT